MTVNHKETHNANRHNRTHLDNNSNTNTLYRLAFTNPYYTVDGISRGFNLSYRETDFAELNSLDYITNEGRATINFGLPVSDTGRVGFDFGYVGTEFKAGASELAQEWEQQYGTDFDDLRLLATWRDDTRDSAIFPREGGSQTFSALLSIPGSDLGFYRLDYRHQRYIPIIGDYILHLGLDVGYGDGLGDTNVLPFFEKLFSAITCPGTTVSPALTNGLSVMLASPLS